MTRDRSNRPSDPPRVVVAGHICLDIIPRLPPDPRRRAFRPGALDLIGPATLAVGGCVGNTGIALHRLGLRTSLVARVGADSFGEVVVDLVRREIPAEAAVLIATAGASTSYSLVLNVPGKDRSIAHYSGVNDCFVADDVQADVLRDAALLHVGYPPLMAAMVANGARELGRLLARAHAAGAWTSVDMASANLERRDGTVRWREALRRILPDVDVFLPSLSEVRDMLGRRVRRDDRGAPVLASVAGLVDELVGMGVAIAGVKMGEHGIYVRSAPADRMAAGPVRLPAAWADRELYSTVFEADVVGTTGAGDATIAGFLFGMLTGMTPERVVTAACAVGGSSTEAADGTSSVASWPEIERRLAAGWRRRTTTPGAGWSWSRDDGLWHGPHDAGGHGG